MGVQIWLARLQESQTSDMGPVSKLQQGPPKSFCVGRPWKFRTSNFEAWPHSKWMIHVTTINANCPKLFSFNWGKVDGEAGSNRSIESFGGRHIRSSGVWMLHCKRGKDLAIVMAHAPSTRGCIYLFEWECLKNYNLIGQSQSHIR